MLRIVSESKMTSSDVFFCPQPSHIHTVTEGNWKENVSRNVTESDDLTFFLNVIILYIHNCGLGQHFLDNAVESCDRWMMRKRPSSLLINVDKEPSVIHRPISCSFFLVTWEHLGHSYLSKGHYGILSPICGARSVSPFLMIWINVCCVRVCKSLIDLSCSWISSPRRVHCGTVIPG